MVSKLVYLQWEALSSFQDSNPVIRAAIIGGGGGGGAFGSALTW